METVNIEKLIKLYEVSEKTVQHLAIAAGLTIEDLDKYYKPIPQYNINEKDVSINSIYFHFLLSLQNRQRMSKVINLWKQKDSYKKIFFDYNPSMVTQEYKSDEDLHKELKEKQLIHTNSDKSQMSKQWCQGSLNGAKKLAKYSSIDMMKEDWKTIWNKNPLDLPDTWQKGIKGMGIALSCDFFKEIGYDLPKPDVHIREVFKQLFNLGELTDKQLCSIFIDAIKRLNKCGIETTAYKFDRMIWLACTGNFFLDSDETTPIRFRNCLIKQCI